jgi:hypothetical protein
MVYPSPRLQATQQLDKLKVWRFLSLGPTISLFYTIDFSFCFWKRSLMRLRAAQLLQRIYLFLRVIQF